METESLLVDTSIVIDHFRKSDKSNSRLVSVADTHTLYISTISIYELIAGATSEDKRKDIDELIKIFDILPFTVEAANRAGEIYIDLRKENKLIEVADILIAAAAQVHELPLLTLNIKHFSRIRKLTLF